ncbi:MAG: GNAT family N-acetyltransferase [Bacillota bacterium]|nr:GNAT family N-acetyltransferase [Bacillota bacterium]
MIKLRLCEAADREQWVRLNRAFMEWELADEGFWNDVQKTDDEAFARIFHEALEHPELSTLFMVEEGDKAIGFANLMTIFSVWAGGKALILDDLFLLEEYRGKGYGRAVMEAIEAHAGQAGYKRLQFQSEFSNPKAHDFYTHLGYESEEMHFYVKYL